MNIFVSVTTIRLTTFVMKWPTPILTAQNSTFERLPPSGGRLKGTVQLEIDFKNHSACTGYA